MVPVRQVPQVADREAASVISQWFKVQSVGSAAKASPECLLEMQNLRCHPDIMNQHQHLCKIPGDMNEPEN